MLKILSRYGFVSTFFSVVSTKLYYLISSIIIVVTIEIIPKFCNNMSFSFFIGIILYIVSMIIIYKISEKWKKHRHEDIEFKKLTTTVKVRIFLVAILSALALDVIYSLVYITLLV